MKIIAITQPFFFDSEAQTINSLFANGQIDMLHLRKPNSTEDECRRLLDAINAEWHHLIAIHEHFGIYGEYQLDGLHLNRRCPTPPAEYAGRLSCSCHSLDEVVQRKPQMDYVFLSPIYDSISKHGYKSGFDKATLLRAADEGIIDKKVVALGGVTRKRISQIEKYGFGGAAMLGDIWREVAAK